MPDEAKIEQILGTLDTRHITTERDAIFASHLDRLLKRDEGGGLLPEARRFSAVRETRGIMVIDGPGGGKSTLVTRGLKRHEVLARGPDGQPLYLSADVPSPATFKSMGLELLRLSGYPEVSERREAWSIWTMLRSRLQMLGVVVLWIDEAHDLFCADRNLILRALKSLMQGDEAVIVILSGTERLAEIVRSDPQVQRRFSTLVLPPVSVATDRENFAAVLSSYCRIAELAEPDDPDLIDRLFHASRHRFGRCIETITGAIEQALRADDDHLDIDHFAHAFALQEGHLPEGNIFTAPDWLDINPDRKNTTEDQAPRSRKRRK